MAKQHRLFAHKSELKQQPVFSRYHTFLFASTAQGIIISRLRILAMVVVTVAAMTMCANPVLANPGNDDGNGSGGSHGDNGSRGNSGRSQKEHASQKSNAQPEQRKSYGKPNHVDSDISYNVARQYTARYDLVGHKSLPPGTTKNLAWGRPLPPGIAKKSAPPSMLNQLSYYPGYEWQVIGGNLVLITLSTAIVTVVINGVFD